MVFSRKAFRRNSTNRSLQDDDGGGSITSLTSTKSKSRWFNAGRSRQKRRSSLQDMLFPSSESSSLSSSEDVTVTVTLDDRKNEKSSFHLPECPGDNTRKNKDDKNCNINDDSGSTAEDSDWDLTCSEGGGENDDNDSCGSLSSDECFGVRFDLSRTQYRDDTARSIGCEMELYDCWYNRLSITSFKMDQRQAVEELFEANVNHNDTVSQRNLHWRQTLQAAFLETQDTQDSSSSSHHHQDSSSFAMLSGSVLASLEQLYADEDSAAFLMGLEFNLLARLRGRPNAQARAILKILERTGSNVTCEASVGQIAALSSPTRRFARSVALAQAKVVQQMQKEQQQ